MSSDSTSNWSQEQISRFDAHNDARRLVRKKTRTLKRLPGETSSEFLSRKCKKLSTKDVLFLIKARKNRDLSPTQ
jgi:hypothetical protein